jgi:hypothetical protein
MSRRATELGADVLVSRRATHDQFGRRREGTIPFAVRRVHFFATDNDLGVPT